MKLTEALTILNDLPVTAWEYLDTETLRAIGLARSALARIETMRLDPCTLASYPLFLETEEKPSFRPDTTISTPGTGEGRMQ